MKNICLVTGGAGYIGAHTVVELINSGYEVVIVDNLSKSDNSLLLGIESITGKKVKFHLGDCADENFLNDIFSKYPQISAALHFAAFKSVGESVANPLKYYSNNINSLVVLLAVMQKHGVTDLIFSSSCTVYGQPDQIPVNESANFKKAESPYGATKQFCERILEDSFKPNFRMISLRYFNPIGAHPSAKIGELPIGVPSNLVPFITQTAAGIRPKLTIFGNTYNTPDGTCIRDYIHVVDLAKAHVKAMQFLHTQKAPFLDAFNLGSGIGVSVLELVNAFIQSTGQALNYEFGPKRDGDVEKVYADPRKANQLLGWQTKYSITESLMHAWSWEKNIRKL
jgi:UDP-glucose 4-epimerase